MKHKITIRDTISKSPAINSSTRKSHYTHNESWTSATIAKTVKAHGCPGVGGGGGGGGWGGSDCY